MDKSVISGKSPPEEEGGAGHSQKPPLEDPPANGMEDSKVKGQNPPPTMEEMLESKLKASEAVVERQRQALEEKQAEIEDLQRKYNEAKQMFRRGWRARKVEWREWKSQLELLTGEGKALLETAQGLKDTLVQVSRLGGMKLEEIRELTMKVEELENGRREKKKSSTLTDAVQKVTGGVQSWGKDPELIFPEEIWRMILESVSDPEDLWHLSNTCQLFQTLLSKWRSGWLLGQSLSYIYKDLPREKTAGMSISLKELEGGY